MAENMVKYCKKSNYFEITIEICINIVYNMFITIYKGGELT